jgi:hypothetical protein
MYMRCYSSVVQIHSYELRIVWADPFSKSPPDYL